MNFQNVINSNYINRQFQMFERIKRFKNLVDPISFVEINKDLCKNILTFSLKESDFIRDRPDLKDMVIKKSYEYKKYRDLCDLCDKVIKTYDLPIALSKPKRACTKNRK